MQTMTKTKAFIVGLVALVLSSSVWANEPDAAISAAVDNLLTEFTAQKTELTADKRKLFALVDQATLPLFDFARISKLILGKNWKQASAAQRQAFGEEFKKLLIGTYATALFQYTGDEKVEFTDVKITEKKGRKTAKVKSEITLVNRPSVPVDYSLILVDDQWKIYNMTIADLNMVQHYRQTYAASIRTNGLDGLLEAMQAANAKNYAG